MKDFANVLGQIESSYRREATGDLAEIRALGLERNELRKKVAQLEKEKTTLLGWLLLIVGLLTFAWLTAKKP